MRRSLISRRTVVFVLLFALTVAAFYERGYFGRFTGSPPAASSAVETAYRERLSGEPVSETGEVIRLLPDDTRGSRHQRFILRLGSGRTVLIAHNIDIAPRIEALQAGDMVEFAGVYEWNEKGGVVHWTHHDPAGRRDGGWLRHRGRVYR